MKPNTERAKRIHFHETSLFQVLLLYVCISVCDLNLSSRLKRGSLYKKAATNLINFQSFNFYFCWSGVGCWLGYPHKLQFEAHLNIKGSWSPTSFWQYFHESACTNLTVQDSVLSISDNGHLERHYPANTMITY